MHAFTTTPTKLLSASTRSILFSYDHNYVVYKRAESSLPTVDGSTSSTTKADGCLVCATTEPLCPSCPNGQECRLRAPSCNQCVEAYCAPLRSDNSGSTPVGAIVGGVVGGVAFLVFLAGLWYFFVFRKRNDYYDEKEGIYMGGSDSVRASGIELGGMANDGTGSLHENSYEAGLNDPNGGGGGGGHNTDQGMNNFNNTANATLTSQGAAQLAGLMAASGISGSGGGVGGTLNSMRPPSAPVQRNKRLSSYESFTKPTIRAALLTKKKAAAGGGNNMTGAGVGVSNSNSMNSRFNDSGSGLIYGLAQQNYLESSNRNSVATSISTTNASNILPIAYIPGVTVRPTKNNTRSIHIDLESLFSDLVTIENASIIGAESTNSKNNSQTNATMTAIKAQPRLVNVEKIDEEDESSEEDGGIQQLDDVDSALGSSIDQGSSRNPGLIHIATKTQVTQVTRAHELGHSHEFGSDDENGDDELSDEDSDIGEITRATSLRRPRVQGIPIGVGVGFDKPPIRPVDRASMRSDDGSFVLDVEIDNDDRNPGTGTIGVSRSTRTTTGAEGSSVHSGERSPFDDP